jgi:hypothetical protein
MMAGRADEYRLLARECVSIALSSSTEEARLTLIEMARVWTRLADEQGAVFPLAEAVGHQTVVLQQQQVQPKRDGGTEGV